MPFAVSSDYKTHARRLPTRWTQREARDHSVLELVARQNGVREWTRL